MSTIEDDVMVKPIQERSTQRLRKENTATEATAFIDSLNLDESMKQMAVLKEIIDNASDTDSAKIAFVKDELSAGRYQIQNYRIAARLLEHAPIIEQPEMA